MTDRRKQILWMSLLLAVLILFFSRILFTDMIIRAPDITNEYFWYAYDLSRAKLLDLFKIDLSSAGWDMLSNSGSSVEGGTSSMQFLGFRNIVYALIPLPTSIAWFTFLHIFFGAAGTFLCCRVIGAGRPASFLGALIFALAPENASLINAGHVMKIATISFAPWAFYFLERGFQTQRLIFFLTTGLVLALQFFNMHWQIAFYTCLCVGAYGVLRLAGILLCNRDQTKALLPRYLGLNLALLVFFLTTVSISLLPLANWSTETNRGIQSGSNQSAGAVQKGGLDVEEAMSWSLPPEELTGFIIPGFFGLSRQEGGDNPDNIASYYWGRMRFTQTVSYMGLLPWLLLPLPLLFRRDSHTWLPLTGIIGGVLFSMGKYTPFYWLLFKFFPGINHFRVPKMMMFIPVLGLAILAARGLDLLMDQEVRKSRNFSRYLAGVTALPVALLAVFAIAKAGESHWLSQFGQMLSAPTRYEQGAYLIEQRWLNLLQETAIAAVLASACAFALNAARKQTFVKFAPWLLMLLFVADCWRINSKFLFLVPPPAQVRQNAAPPAVVPFLASMPKTHRILPMDGSDPMLYVSQGIPVMFTPNAVQQQRWQSFLDSFILDSAMPDILNVKYYIFPTEQYAVERDRLGDRYQPVFRTPDGSRLVVENRTVLPKAWLVPSVAVIADQQRRLGILQNPGFDPRSVALVESPPPVAMPAPGKAMPWPGQLVSLTAYESERIVVEAASPANSLLVLGEKYYKGWQAFVDGANTPIVPVNHVLRGVYLTPGRHVVEFRFDPLPFKIGKYLTLASFALFAVVLWRDWSNRKKGQFGKGRLS